MVGLGLCARCTRICPWVHSAQNPPCSVSTSAYLWRHDATRWRLVQPDSSFSPFPNSHRPAKKNYKVVVAHKALCVSNLFVRSPFRAKHHVVVQFMTRWLKCPLPLSPNPPPPNPLRPPHRRQGGQGRIGDITGKARDFALQLPWTLLLVSVLDSDNGFEHARAAPVLGWTQGPPLEPPTSPQTSTFCWAEASGPSDSQLATQYAVNYAGKVMHDASRVRLGPQRRLGPPTEAPRSRQWQVWCAHHPCCVKNNGGLMIWSKGGQYPLGDPSST